jgi:long-chain acyl-CoA synthetase
MVICLEGSLPLFQSIQVQTAVKTIILTRVEDAFQLLSPASRSQMPVTHRMVTQKNEIVSQTTLAMTFGSNKGGGVVWLTSLLPQYWGATRPEVEVGPDDPAIFQYSGGTTGTPKAAAALHRNLVANMLQFSAWLAPMRSEQDAMLAAIPLFHVFGMVIAMGVAVLFEAAIVLVPNPRDLADLLANIDQNRVTIFPTVPNLLFSINQFLSKEGSAYDLSSLRLCISGSAPLLKPVKERFEQLTRARVVEGYGLSEAPTALTCNPVLGENRTGSIGLPLPDVDCRIVSLEDGQTVLGQGKTGELIALSPQLMAGYHNQPEATCLALRGGWLYTGDVAFIDAQGYFYLVDRKKDLIKVGGLQVWPREVEEAIATHPKVLEVGVTGVMHPGYGETVKAWVVARAGENLSAEEVVAWCKDRLAEYKAPRKVAFLSQLPRSAVGKVLRRELGKLDADKS